MIKCRLQAVRESYAQKGLEAPRHATNAFALTKSIFAAEGIRGLFKGLKPTFVREMPGYFCFFYAYEFSREVLANEGQKKDDIGPLKTITAGGIAGTTLWTVIFPADVIKSRQQVKISILK